MIGNTDLYRKTLHTRHYVLGSSACSSTLRELFVYCSWGPDSVIWTLDIHCHVHNHVQLRTIIFSRHYSPRASLNITLSVFSFSFHPLSFPSLSQGRDAAPCATRVPHAVLATRSHDTSRHAFCELYVSVWPAAYQAHRGATSRWNRWVLGAVNFGVFNFALTLQLARSFPFMCVL